MITRPRAQLGGFKERILELAPTLENHLLELPLLEIVPKTSPTLSQDLWNAVNESEWVHFASPNAFLVANQILIQSGHAWPENLRVALIGGGTEDAMAAAGVKPVQIIKPNHPEKWDSEGLLEELQKSLADWSGKSFVFLQGDGGRGVLANELLKAGAIIKELPMYSRCALSTKDPYWQRVKNHLMETPKPLKWLWILTSSQACHSLISGLHELGMSGEVLQTHHAITTHPRIARTARELGFGGVTLSTPGDVGLANLIVQMSSEAV